MKKIILFTFFIFSLPFGKGWGWVVQAQITFPAAGATWHYLVEKEWGGAGQHSYNDTVVTYIKDTLFMGRTVKVLNTPYYFSSQCPWVGRTYIYTNNDSVFFYNSQTLNQWQLLYSFNTPVGQSWQIYYKDYDPIYGTNIDTITVKVDSVKNTVINAVSLKTLFVTYTEVYHTIGHISTYRSVIYDRVGDTNYVFNFISGISLNCSGCGWVQGLLCYSDSTLGLYQPDITKSCTYLPAGTGIEQVTGNNNQVTVYPNPAQSALHIKTDIENIDSYKITNTLGELILQGNYPQSVDVSALSNGIYFIRLYEQTKLVYSNKFLKE